MTWAIWINLCFASFAISLSPGPGAVSSMASGLRYGFPRGYWNAIGLAIGYATQYIISVIGVGAVLATSSTAFEVVKWIGVLYLLYLGYKQVRSPVAIIRIDDTSTTETTFSATKLIYQGMLVNLTNPKGAVFLIAITPQFLNVNAPVIPQYIIICMTLVIADMIVMAGYTGLAAKIMKFMHRPHHAARLNKVFGFLFIMAAIFMALLSK